jgi:hypothetical protein
MVSIQIGESNPTMDMEDVKAEIGILLTDMQSQPEDRHELYMQILEKLNEMKAFGMPLPEDLVELEKALEAEFAEEKKAADRGDAQE